jgi:hypothetical protein
MPHPALSSPERRSGGSRWGLAWCVLFVVAAALHAAGPLWDTDLFWHLKIGQLTLRTGHLLASDPLTYTAGHHPWIQHEWGGQVLLALVERLGGFVALRAAQSALMGGFLALLAIAFYRATGERIWIAAVFLGLAWLGAEPNAGLRPHLFGWILAAIVFGLWWSPRPPRGSARELVLLVFITALWVNLHSSALLLPLAAAAGAAEDWIFGSGKHLRGWLRRVGAASLGTLLSPAGWRLYPYAWATPRIDVDSEEWQPLFTRDSWGFRPAVVLLVALLIPALVFLAVALWKQRGALAALFPGPLTGLGFVALAAQHRRMVAFVFVSLLAVAVALRRLGWIRAPMSIGLARPGLVRLLRISLLAALLAVAARQGVLALRANDLRAENYPLQAAEFLAETRLQGHVLNPPDWGGYLSWRLHPELSTFADGRWLEVGGATIQDGARMLLHGADASLFDGYSIAFLIQSTPQYFRSPPLGARDWRLAWIDPVAIVLLRAGPSLDDDSARVCAFRRAHPELAAHFEWPFSLAADVARTRVASVRCTVR